MTAIPRRPGRTAWVKARDTLLHGAGHGAPMPDEQAVDSEGALVLSYGEATVVIEGSYRRLLKTLDYARHQLLETAPELQRVAAVPPEDEEPGEAIPGLRCPHCGATVFDGDTGGIRVVDYGERWSSAGYTEDGKVGAASGQLVGAYGPSPELATDRYECEACGRPVNLPEGVDEALT